ncbi:MAG TPA: hypothetical protein VJ508_06525, partial [Saprospiraceae bacterium]|nr:hypothetical protein [Saprospiraceae bacterium]
MRSLVGVLSVCLLSSVIHAQDSVSVSDFRYPETKALDWKGSLFGNFGSGNSSESQNQTDRESSGGSFDLRSDFFFFHSKDNHDHSINVSGSFRYDKSDVTASMRSGSISYPSSELRDDKLGRIMVDWAYLHYLTTEGFHIFGAFDAAYYSSYHKSNSTSATSGGTSSSESIDKYMTYSDEGFAGIGYGRMRDGSFVFQALRIVERLKDIGLITTTLSRDQMLSLIGRVAHEREYTTNYERSDKYLAQDIVEELEKIGAIDKHVITAFASLKVIEAFRENIDTRLFGWRVYYAIGAGEHQVLDDYKRDSYISHNYNKYASLLHRVGGEFGHPFSLYTHIHAESILELPNHYADSDFLIKFSVAVTHQVAER